MRSSRPWLAAMAIALIAAAALGAQQPDTSRVPPLDRANLDTTCAACQDFYHYANGGWIARTTIPAAFSTWGSFAELGERNNSVLRRVLERAAATQRAGPPQSPEEAKLGVFYASCMDSTAAERAGAEPLRPALGRIDAIATRAALVNEIARLQAQGIGAAFSFSAQQDPKNAARVIATLSQGGLGMPDRDYYTRTDSSSRALRAAYESHIRRTFELLGERAAAAQRDAERVMALETALANASMTRVQRRDPQATYHLMSTAQLRQTAPAVNWTRFFTDMGQPGISVVNVEQPAFLGAVDSLVRTAPLSAWQAYLRWRLASEASPYLSSAFVNENFRFARLLSGATELLPRWRRCLQTTDNALGELLGQAYVREAFSPQAKARALEMVKNLRAALQDRLGRLSWMSDSTRAQALAKLAAFQVKIGYPDKWRDYSALVLSPGPFLDNLQRAARFDVAHELAEIGKPVDRTEWGMTPPTVNAYYNPAMNEIVFPAGILQPPFFAPLADDAVNYGGMGAVIGHEISHGFDDEGRQFDAQGNLRDWWTAADAAAFAKRVGKIVNQFNGYIAVDSIQVNGKLTLGENIGDFAGLTIAYAALEKSLQGQPRPTIDGFTPEQRFFLAWAQIWRQRIRPERARVLALTNPHAPAEWRVNGPLANMPEFARAFSCTAGSAMVRPDSARAQIW